MYERVARVHSDYLKADIVAVIVYIASDTVHASIDLYILISNIFAFVISNIAYLLYQPYILNILYFRHNFAEYGGILRFKYGRCDRSLWW